MKITKLPISDVLVLEPEVYRDDRGFFIESYQQDDYRKAGLPNNFVQDNHSHSVKGVLRGLHTQIQKPQGKLIRVIQGEVYDVAVDARPSSPTFGQWISIHLSGDNHKQLYVPPGFLHGFCVLSETADVVYKCTDFYNPEYETGVVWNDKDLSIDWPIAIPHVSPKDNTLPGWSELIKKLGN